MSVLIVFFCFIDGFGWPHSKHYISIFAVNFTPRYHQTYAVVSFYSIERCNHANSGQERLVAVWKQLEAQRFEEIMAASGRTWLTSQLIERVPTALLPVWTTVSASEDGEDEDERLIYCNHLGVRRVSWLSRCRPKIQPERARVWPFVAHQMMAPMPSERERP